MAGTKSVGLMIFSEVAMLDRRFFMGVEVALFDGSFWKFLMDFGCLGK